MVPKVSGFNQPETLLANAHAHRDVFQARLPWQEMVKLTKAGFLSSWRHNLPSKVSLCTSQTARNV